MIPQEHTEAVCQAVREAFGVPAFDEISPMPAGTSALVYRIIVRGSPYLLKIVTRPGDPSNCFAVTRAAADAGLSPRLWYANPETRVLITDFLEIVPLPLPDALVRVPAALHSVHTLPKLHVAPPHLNTTCTFLLHPGPARDGFFSSFRKANLLPQAESSELLARFDQLLTAYACAPADMVPSHNDLFKPDNMLFDGHRLWLVDWEAAFHNDRYADLAVVANLIVEDDDQEKLFLREYLGCDPGEFQLARLFLMRQIAHVFYAAAFLLIGSAGRPVDLTHPVPGFRDFCRRMWTGEVTLGDNPTKILYARAHWQQLQHNIGTPRWHESLQLVHSFK